MARVEVEFLRTNVTVGRFLAYVRAQLKKRGLDEWANVPDYEDFIADNGIDWKIDHRAQNDTAYTQLGIEYEIVRDMPCEKKSYQRKANGKVSNEIIEFIFDSENTGRGYYYLVDDGVEDEIEPVESETEAETEAESESEPVESVDNTENDACALEHAAIDGQNEDAGNLDNRERGNKNMSNSTKETKPGFKPIPLHGVNADVKIAAALEAVQGKCKARTIDSEDIKNAIAQMERYFGIPKCKLDGLIVVCDVNGQSFPNAYRFVPESTIFCAENRKGKWYVTSIRRAPTYAPARAVQVRHMPETMADAIIERHYDFGI